MVFPFLLALVKEREEELEWKRVLVLFRGLGLEKVPRKKLPSAYPWNILVVVPLMYKAPPPRM